MFNSETKDKHKTIIYLSILIQIVGNENEAITANRLGTIEKNTYKNKYNTILIYILKYR